jgi:hypothetical protein
MGLERWTNPKRSRPTCTCEYGLQSRRGKSAGVAKRACERSPTRNPYPHDSQLVHRFLHPLSYHPSTHLSSVSIIIIRARTEASREPACCGVACDAGRLRCRWLRSRATPTSWCLPRTPWSGGSTRRTATCSKPKCSLGGISSSRSTLRRCDWRAHCDLQRANAPALQQ